MTGSGAQEHAIVGCEAALFNPNKRRAAMKYVAMLRSSWL